MIILYFIINIVTYVLSLKVFRRKINPVSIYNIIWLSMVTAFELKLIYYYDLTILTWLVIIAFHLAYSMGCYFGAARLGALDVPLSDIKLDYKNENMISKKFLFVILLLSIIASLAIIPNFVNLVSKYGINVLSKTNQIYHDRLNNSQNIEIIPYIGTLSHLAVILTGIYISKYRFKLSLLFPLSLLILNMLPTGGRSDFILAILYIFFPIIIEKRKVNLSKKSKISIVVILSIFVGIFIKITSSRSAWVTVTPYMSPFIAKLTNINPAFYKIYEYFTVPVGVLNAYLKNPNYKFGINSFGAIISLLNKFGAGLEYRRYQEAYSIPIYTNVGSYIRELTQDFTIIGGVLVIFCFGFLYGKVFRNSQNRKSFLSSIYTTLFSTIIFMSFFVWFYRETVFWVTTILAIPVGLYLDRIVIKAKKKQFGNTTEEVFK